MLALSVPLLAGAVCMALVQDSCYGGMVCEQFSDDIRVAGSSDGCLGLLLC